MIKDFRAVTNILLMTHSLTELAVIAAVTVLTLVLTAVLVRRVLHADGDNTRDGKK